MLVTEPKKSHFLVHIKKLQKHLQVFPQSCAVEGYLNGQFSEKDGRGSGRGRREGGGGSPRSGQWDGQSAFLDLID